jgi:hypothetical protein
MVESNKKELELYARITLACIAHPRLRLIHLYRRLFGLLYRYLVISEPSGIAKEFGTSLLLLLRLTH